MLAVKTDALGISLLSLRTSAKLLFIYNQLYYLVGNQFDSDNPNPTIKLLSC